MTDYTNGFGGATKDATNATILGAEIDSELDNIETMSATKANKIASPVENDIILQSAAGDLVAAGWGFPNVNADITASDEEINAIDALTASRVLVTDSSGLITVDDITPTKLGYLTDVTSNIQAQIDAVTQPSVSMLKVTTLLDILDSTTTVPDLVSDGTYEAYDDAGVWSSGSPTRITVPSGATHIRISAQVGFWVYTGSDYTDNGIGERNMTLNLNGAAWPSGSSDFIFNVNGNALQALETRLNGTTGIMKVDPFGVIDVGDYVELVLWQNSGATLKTVVVSQWVCVEVWGV